MHLTQLWVYPIKSCTGVRLSEAVLDERGLQHDRRWMLVDVNGKLVTQREIPQLIWVKPQLENPKQKETALTLNAPEMPELRLEPGDVGEMRRVSVWNDHMDALSIPQVRDWFQEFTKKDVDLVYMPDSSSRPMNPKFGKHNLTFVDGNPLHIISESSVANLNTRLEHPVELSRFRANLIFSGAEAFAEDAWKQITIGDISFDVYEACQRCVLLNIDPSSAAVSKEPLATLARYRRFGHHVLFGQNIAHHQTGVIQVGVSLHSEITKASR